MFKKVLYKQIKDTDALALSRLFIHVFGNNTLLNDLDVTQLDETHININSGTCVQFYPLIILTNENNITIDIADTLNTVDNGHPLIYVDSNNGNVVVIKEVEQDIWPHMDDHILLAILEIQNNQLTNVLDNYMSLKVTRANLSGGMHSFTVLDGGSSIQD